ncbi:hypothetical protein Agub_g15177, partial [Astrephomene gubernaculifera]
AGAAGAAGAGGKGPRIEVLAWGPWVADLLRVYEKRAGAVHVTEAAAGATEASSAAAAQQMGSLQEQQQAELAAAAAGAADAAIQPQSQPQHPAPPHAAVASLLRRCVRALQLSHQAASESGDGNHGEAVALLRQALQLLHPPSPAATHEPPSTNPDCVPSLVLGPNHILSTRLRAQLLKAAIDSASNNSSSNSNNNANSSTCWSTRTLHGPTSACISQRSRNWNLGWADRVG